MPKLNINPLLVLAFLFVIGGQHVDAQEVGCLKATVKANGKIALRKVKVKSNGKCPKGTVLDSAGGVASTTVLQRFGLLSSNSLTPVKVSELGNFVKSQNNSDLQITFEGSATARAISNGAFCQLAVRVNNLDVNGGANSSTSPGIVILGAQAGDFPDGTSISAPFSATSVYKDLPAGSHALSIWIAGGGGECIISPGNGALTVTIQELGS